MNFEELESTWQKHATGAAPAADAARLAGQLARDLDRRSLYLKLLLGCTAVGLLLEFEPLFRLLQSRPYAGFRFGAELAKFACHQVIYAALFVFLIRRLRQHARHVRASGESIRQALGTRLAALEAEMGDYRRAAWFAVPMTVLMFWSAWLNQAVAREGWAAFWPRAGIVFGFVLVVIGVAAWYYRHRLVPERDRLAAAQADWGA
jgi:hypothetical protein